MDIKLCETCNGEGFLEKSISPGEKETVMCTKCKGKGRILTKTYTINVPFGCDRLKLNEVDHEIILLIRSLDNKLNNIK